MNARQNNHDTLGQTTPNNTASKAHGTVDDQLKDVSASPPPLKLWLAPGVVKSWANVELDSDDREVDTVDSSKPLAEDELVCKVVVGIVVLLVVLVVGHGSKPCTPQNLH